jgi:hypothetical protein
VNAIIISVPTADFHWPGQVLAKKLPSPRIRATKNQSMTSMGDDDDQNQECKCYKILSVKPITDKQQVFDMVAKFLQSDRQRQQSAVGEDRVREKASWNELRRWANSLLTENDCVEDIGNTKKRKHIEDWVDHTIQFDEEGYEEKIEDEQRRTSEGIVKVETTEAMRSSEVAIVGRSAHATFVDHVSKETYDGSSDVEQNERESKEERRARKKAKKEAKKAKKAKKDAKKLAKKEKKSSKKIKTED